MENIIGSRFFPHWAEIVVEVNNADKLKLLTVKKVDASDISEQHNGFLLPRVILKNNLDPYLTYEERETWRRINSEASSSSDGRNYDGLNVSVFIEGGWRFELFLTHNDESGCTVFKGNELELFRRFGNFKEGDHVMIWMLRHNDLVKNKSKLCFYFVKI